MKFTFKIPNIEIVADTEQEAIDKLDEELKSCDYKIIKTEYESEEERQNAIKEEMINRNVERALERKLLND